jgi:hypothetical protein
MTDRRTLQFSSQGFRTQEIEIAPDVLEETVSKRQPLIQEEVRRGWNPQLCVCNLLHVFLTFSPRYAPTTANKHTGCAARHQHQRVRHRYQGPQQSLPGTAGRNMALDGGVGR